jgi:hypothetical protein
MELVQLGTLMAFGQETRFASLTPMLAIRNLTD